MTDWNKEIELCKEWLKYKIERIAMTNIAVIEFNKSMKLENHDPNDFGLTSKFYLDMVFFDRFTLTFEQWKRNQS